MAGGDRVPMTNSFSTYSFADKDPLVNAMTGPELPLEFVSELSSKDESCNVENVYVYLARRGYNDRHVHIL